MTTWICECCGARSAHVSYPIICQCGLFQRDAATIIRTPENCSGVEVGESDGAGSYLTRFFSLMYIKDDGTCDCKELARKMDRNGPKWCEKNLEMIVGKLRENAGKRGLPFSEWLARGLVKQSIRYAYSLTESTANPS